MTALSDRAKPIPKIVARASEVFIFKGNFFVDVGIVNIMDSTHF